MVSQPPGSQLVIIGAQAGDIEALSTVLATLPPDFPVPLIVAQHLNSLHANALEEILAQRGTLPVQTVTDHAPLRPGTVYVVPANQYVAIVDHALTLPEDAGDRTTPPIDLLFQSAARTFGEELIAVLLAGMGMDGANGARAVKEVGGTVVIQNPRTPGSPALPPALAPTLVDIVADLERIGPLLHDLLTGTSLPLEDEQALHASLARMREQRGIDFSRFTSPGIERRFQRRMVATKRRHIAEYLAYLESHPEEYERLIRSFVGTVGSFFGDPDMYSCLSGAIIPDLLAHADAHNQEIRIWSAGCATGEDAYSLAILVCEALRKSPGAVNVRIFATDRDDDAIAFARHGIYPQAAVAGMGRDLCERYFVQVDGAYEMHKFVRNMVVFGRHDLMDLTPFPHIDLCLCRNVLNFFTPTARLRAMQHFAFSLRHHGYLVLDTSDAVTVLPEYFVPVQSDRKLFQRTGKQSVITLAPALDHERLATHRPSGHQSPAVRDLERVRRAAQAVKRAPVQKEDVLAGLPAGVALVDAHYDIQIINHAARRLLGIYRAAIGEDIVHLAHTVSPDVLREGIDRALRGEAFSTVDDIATEAMLPGTTTYLQITCTPHHRQAEANQVDSVLIMVLDTTSTVRLRLAQEQEAGRARQAASEEVARLEAELARVRAQVEAQAVTNREILLANDDLTAMNAALQNINDEVQINSEQIQAVVEEVETLNEELNASNEEWATLNEELNATVEELNTTNQELHAHSLELQNQAAVLEEQRRISEAQRQRLREVFVQTPALLALTHGPSHIFEMASGAFLQGIGHTEEEFKGRTIQDIWPQVVATRLVEQMNIVFATGAPTDVREVQVRAVRYPHMEVEEAYWTFELKPMRMVNGAIEGVLLAVIDLTDQVRSRRHIEELMHQASTAQVRLEAILASMGDAVLVVDVVGRPLIRNAAYDRLFGSHATLPMEDDQGRPLPPDTTPAQRAARGETFSIQFTLPMDEGGRRWFEANGHPITTPRLGDGVEHWGLVVIRDITDRNLRHMREEFIATVSHELQTPLTAIRASLGMIETTAAARLDPDERELLDGARLHVERLRVQIDDLLAANQIEAGTLRIDMGPCDMGSSSTEPCAPYNRYWRKRGNRCGSICRGHCLFWEMRGAWSRFS